MQLPPDGPILVIGPGALGVLVAARLAAAGHDVIVAARTPESAAQLQRDGVVAIAHDGARLPARPRVLHAAARFPGPARMAVLATKCDAALPALLDWLPAIGDDAPVVCLQNGVLGDLLAPVLGDRHVECTVSIPATLESPGVSRQTGPGSLHIGPWPEARGRDDPKAYKRLAGVLADVAPVRASPNMRGTKWTKLLVNSCITTLGAATGRSLGDLLALPRARAAFLAIVREGYVAGRADGVRFEAVAGFRPALFAAAVPGRGVLLRLLGRKYRRQRSSSLQSLQRGRRTEVDYLNGHIVATAAKHRLPAPVNGALVALLHDIEAGRRQPDPANLDALGL